MSGNLCCPTLQAFQGWNYDVFICHTGDDKPFVQILYGEMQKCGLRAFFDKESLEKGDEVQATIANAIINSTFFVVVLSWSFLDQEYPEAELKAALAFPEEYKKRIMPVFYKMTADECHGWTRKMYRKLADSTGWERKSESDQQFAESISQKIKQIAEQQLHSSTSKAVCFIVL